MLRVEGQELLHVGKGVSLLDVEAAPGALADSEVADLGVVAHCGEAQVGENTTRQQRSVHPHLPAGSTLSPLNIPSLSIKLEQHNSPLDCFIPLPTSLLLPPPDPEHSFGPQRRCFIIRDH